MDTQPPVTPEDGHTTRVTTGDDAFIEGACIFIIPNRLWRSRHLSNHLGGPCLIFVRLSPLFYLESEPKGVAEASQKAAEQVEPEQTAGPVAESPDVILETETQALETLATALDDKSTSATEKPIDKDKDDKDRTRDPEKEKLKEKGKDGEKKLDKETEKEKVKGVEGASLDSLLQRLPGCVSRDRIDQLTVFLFKL